MAEIAQKIRVTKIPEGQQLFADGVEIFEGSIIRKDARIVGKWTATFCEGERPPDPRLYGFIVVDDPSAEIEGHLAQSADPKLPAEWMTDAQLAEIEARADAATPGPWTLGPSPYFCVDMGDGRPLRETWFREDAEFIACAREDVPALLAEVRRLRARNAGLMSVAKSALESLEQDVCDHDTAALAPIVADLRKRVGS